MDKIASDDPESKKLVPVGKRRKDAEYQEPRTNPRMARSGKCHSPEARAKAGATNHARAAARRAAEAEAEAARGPLLADIAAADVELAQHALRAAFRGELGANLNGAIGANLRGLQSAAGRANRGPEWEEEINRWTREFVASWKASWQKTWDEQRHRVWGTRNSPEVSRWLTEWEGLGKPAGVKAAVRHGAELCLAGRKIPPYEVDYLPGKPGERKEPPAAIYLAALVRGWQEAKTRRELWNEDPEEANDDDDSWMSL
jgi:hypothetical protein